MIFTAFLFVAFAFFSVIRGSKYYKILGKGRYEFTRHLSGNIFGSYRHTKYEDQANGRIDKTPTAGCSLSYRITEWLVSQLFYTYKTVTSTNNEKEYTENRGMLIMSVSPVQPYRL